MNIASLFHTKTMAFILCGLDFLFAGICILQHLGISNLEGTMSSIFTVKGICLYISLKLALLYVTCAVSYPFRYTYSQQWVYRIPTMGVCLLSILGVLPPIWCFSLIALAGLLAYIGYRQDALTTQRKRKAMKL